VNFLALVQRNNFKGVSHCSEGKKCKTIKSRGGRVALVVGEDMKIAQIDDLDDHAIVGKFMGRRIAHMTNIKWMDKEWGVIWGYLPICHLLSRG
jgi:hypothetical protein